MKTNPSPNPLEDLNLVTPAMPLHEQRLRQAIVTSAPTKRSFIYTTARSMKILKGLSTALTICAVIAVAGYTIFNKKYAPHAQAQELANQSMLVARQLTPAEIARFNKQYGGTPEQALADAEKAPDLKIITQDQFQDLFSNPGNGTVSMTVQAQDADGNVPSTSAMGTPGSGQMMVVSGSSTIASGESGSVTAEGSGPDGAGVMTLSTGGIPVPVGANVPGSGSVQILGQGGAATTGTLNQTSSVNAPILPAPQTVMALKYLEYTDANGDTVVIGMNAENKPVMKATKSSGSK